MRRLHLLLCVFWIVLICPGVVSGQFFSIDPIYHETPRFAASGNWGYHSLKIDAVYSKLKESKRVSWAFVFDTSADTEHDDLIGVLDRDKSKSFTGEPKRGTNGHSIHCSGIIAADPPGDVVKIGICEPLVKAGKIRLVLIKVLSNAGSGSYSTITDALRYANPIAAELIQNGNAVIYSFSLGGGSDSPTINALLFEAWNAGVFIVGANGNTGAEGVQFPGRSPSVRAIAALTSNLTRASFSTYGAQTYAAAPGSRIYSTWLGGGYKEASGTSMATPAIAGVVCNLMSYFDKANNNQIDKYLTKQLTDISPDDWDKYTGYGFPDMPFLLSGNPMNEEPGTPAPEPQPNPEPEPTPEHPTARATNVNLEHIYSVNFGGSNGHKYERWGLRFEVEALSRANAKTTAYDVKQAFDKHFRGRGYWIGGNADSNDLIFWASFFVEKLIERDFGLKVRVLRCEASPPENVNPMTYINEPLKNKPARIRRNAYKVRNVNSRVHTFQN